MPGKTSALIEKLSSIIAEVRYTSKTSMVVESSLKTVFSSVTQLSKTVTEYTLGKFVELYQQYISDTTNIADSKKLVVGKNIGETTVTSDSAVLATTKSISDSAVLTDSIQKQVTYSRGFSDTNSITDVTRNSTVKPNLDYVNLSDQVSSVKVFSRGFNESIYATDDLNGAGVDDDQNIVFFKNTGDLNFVSDNISFSSLFIREFYEQNTVSDTSATIVGKFVSDTTTIVDNFTRTVVYNRQLIETVLFTEIVASSYSKLLYDTGTVTDSTSTAVQYNRLFTEDINATDDINGAAVDDDQNVVFFKNSSDLIQVSELLEFYSTFNRNFEDQTTLADSSTVNVSKNIFDNIALQDTIDELLVLGVFPTDSINTTDDLNGAGVDDDQNITFFKNLPSEVLALSDQNFTEVGKNIPENLQISSLGVILNQNYGADYFSQDYVGVSRSIT